MGLPFLKVDTAVLMEPWRRVWGAGVNQGTLTAGIAVFGGVAVLVRSRVNQWMPRLHRRQRFCPCRVRTRMHALLLACLGFRYARVIEQWPSRQPSVCMHYSILGGGGWVVYPSAGQNIACLLGSPHWNLRPCQSALLHLTAGMIDFTARAPLQLWCVGAVEAHGWLDVAAAPRRRCAGGCCLRIFKVAWLLWATRPVLCVLFDLVDRGRHMCLPLTRALFWASPKLLDRSQHVHCLQSSVVPPKLNARQA